MQNRNERLFLPASTPELLEGRPGLYPRAVGSVEGRRGSPGEQEHGGGGQGVTSVLRAGNTRLHVGLRTCASKVAEDSGLCVDGRK